MKSRNAELIERIDEMLFAPAPQDEREALAPCPFCGGRGFWQSEHDADGFGLFWAIRCGGCGNGTQQHYVSHGNDFPEFRAEVRGSWNRRAAPAAVSPMTDEQWLERARAAEWLDDLHADMLEWLTVLKAAAPERECGKGAVPAIAQGAALLSREEVHAELRAPAESGEFVGGHYVQMTWHHFNEWAARIQRAVLAKHGIGVADGSPAQSKGGNSDA